MAFYPFDPNGILASNLLTDELHTVSSVNGINHQYMVPRDAPFFDSSMVVVDADSGTILTKGIDYDLGWPFDAGLSEVGVGLSGAVYLIDKNKTANFKLRYQTLGGDFVTATTRLITDGLKTLNDLTLVKWDDIAPATIPTTWPATPHTQTVTDVEAVVELIDGINAVVNALTSAPPYIHVADIIDLDSQYFQPMIQATEDIADAIRNNLSKSLNYEIYKLPLNPTVTLNTLLNTWQDTGLVGAPPLDGTYIINKNFHPLFQAGENPAFRTRVVISSNSGVSYNEFPDGYLDGVPLGITSGWLVKLQVMFLESHSGAIIASDDIGKEVNTSFSLVRVGS